MQSRPPPSPTLAAAVAFGIMCMCVALGMRGAWELRQWLIMLAAATFAIGGVTLVCRLEHHYGVERWEKVWRHPRAPALGYLLLALVMLLATLAMNSRSGGSVLVGLMSMPVAGLYFGLAISTLGVIRISSGRYCRKCQYEMSDAIATDPACERCPECGSLWKQPGGSVGGRVIYRWQWITVGAVLGVTLSLWPLVVPKSVQATALRILPTNSLIEEAAMGGIAKGDQAWNELMARHLTPAEEERLALRLLDGRNERGFLLNAPDTWLQMRSAAGLPTPELAQRYIDEHPHPRALPAGLLPPALPPAPDTAGSAEPGGP